MILVLWTCFQYLHGLDADYRCSFDDAPMRPPFQILHSRHHHHRWGLKTMNGIHKWNGWDDVWCRNHSCNLWFFNINFQFTKHSEGDFKVTFWCCKRNNKKNVISFFYFKWISWLNHSWHQILQVVGTKWIEKASTKPNLYWFECSKHLQTNQNHMLTAIE